VKKKHIIIVSSYTIHDELAVNKRVAAYIDVLLLEGWKVTLLAASYYGDKCLAGTLTHKRDYYDILYVPFKKYKRDNFVTRGFHELIHSLSILRAAVKVGADCALITIPSIFLLLFALHRPANICAVDVRDLVWEYLPEHPWWMRLCKKVLKKGAIFALSFADIITLSNPSEMDYLRNILKSKQMLVVSNGISRQQYHLIVGRTRQIRHDDVLRVAYIGNIGLAQNLTTLVQAVAGIDRIQVNYVGGGSDYERVKKVAADVGAINVHFHGPMRWEDAVTWYDKSDVLYTQLTPDYVTAVPSKLYEYLATGLPVIYGGCGAATQLLRQFSGVTVIEPNSPERLRIALLSAMKCKFHEIHSDNIIRIGNEFIREDHAALFVQTLSDLNFSTLM
jgi:glycosyltransferase involved in cell wall biosynthesis